MSVAWFEFLSVTFSADFLAEISVRSPRQLLILYYLQKHFLDQTIQKIVYLSLKTEALVPFSEIVYRMLFNVFEVL